MLFPAIAILYQFSEGHYSTVSQVQVGTEIMALKQMKPNYDIRVFGDELSTAITAGLEGFGPKIHHVSVDAMAYTQDLVNGTTLTQFLKQHGYTYHSAVENYTPRPFYDFAKLHPHRAQEFSTKLSAFLNRGHCHGDLYAKNVMHGVITTTYSPHHRISTIDQPHLYAIDFGYGGMGHLVNSLHRRNNHENHEMTFRETDFSVITVIQDALESRPYTHPSCLNVDRLAKHIHTSVTTLQHEIPEYLC